MPNTRLSQLRNPALAGAAVVLLALLALFVLLGACGADSGGGRTGHGAVVMNMGDCSPDNLTATCTCADKNNISGRQTCASGAWSACECEAVATGGAGMGGTGSVATDGGVPSATVDDPPGNKSATRFAWQRTPFELGSCKAGHYVGNFMGFYGSPAIFTIPVPVVSAATADGKPGLEFWLNKKPGSGEIFAVDMGVIRGTADGAFPFTIDLNGELDCKTKKFVGQLTNGQYDVFGTKYMFEGVITADYDKLQNKFIGGKWNTTEPGSNPPATGSGDWDATWSAM